MAPAIGIAVAYAQVDCIRTGEGDHRDYQVLNRHYLCTGGGISAGISRRRG
ncbi:MAG: hypothetical protein IPJ06_02540 [Saprospiraceae bacterium]|nr:hypothetical protein [Saprospiraceae bacterium]